MIPKIIHQIWIGNKTLSHQHRKYIEKWKIMNPSFQHILWENDCIKNIIPIDKIQYFTDKHPIALQADILRYEIIRKYGGVYIDVDMEPLKPLTPIMLDCVFFGGIQNNGQVAIGIFGAELECPLIVDTCDGIVDNINKSMITDPMLQYVDSITGPGFFDGICNKYKNFKDYTFYDSTYFYPYWFTELHRKNENFQITCPDAYSVHHWDKNWF